MQQLAIIDCGTNTFHLLIVEVGNASFHTVYKLQIPVKLGEGGINQQLIQPPAFKRGVEALIKFSTEIKAREITKVLAFGTSAIRSAQNGADFITEVKKETGIELEMISGVREAELIFKGVQQTYNFTADNALVMDIGGGSVEFIIANQNGIQWHGSFEIGAARLVEKFHRTEPISPADVKALDIYLEKELQPLLLAAGQFPVKTLVGSAGSFDSICEIINWEYKRHLLEHGELSAEIEIDDYTGIHSLLLNSTLEDRKKMPGLIDYRVEMMVVSTCLINYVVHTMGITRMYCSTYSMKEGMLVDMIGS